MANHISDFDPITIWPACPIAELVLVANDVWKPPVRWYALTPTALDYCAASCYAVLSRCALLCYTPLRASFLLRSLGVSLAVSSVCAFAVQCHCSQSAAPHCASPTLMVQDILCWLSSHLCVD